MRYYERRLVIGILALLFLFGGHLINGYDGYESMIIFGVDFANFIADIFIIIGIILQIWLILLIARKNNGGENDKLIDEMENQMGGFYSICRSSC